MGNFKKDLLRGKIGEERTKIILNNLPKVKECIDVRGDKEYQDKDIDFEIITVNGKRKAIECKTDKKAQKTGNLYYETLSSKTKGTIGCFEKTKSNLIFYYCIGCRDMYVFNTKKLQNHVKLHGRNYEIVSGGDDSRGLLIPLNIIADGNIGFKYNN